MRRLLWTLLWLCLPAIAPAQEVANLLADRVSIAPGPVLLAEGHVEVFFGDTRLTATAILYDQARDSLQITGPILITAADGAILTADSATLDPQLRNGLLRGARLVLDRQLQLAANRIDRVEGRWTALTGVAATSCHVCAGRPPLWDIRAGQVIHDQQDRQLYFEDATLRVGGVPVFWLPRMRLPDPTLDRATGFLIPGVRTTDQLGPGLRLPYFITLGDSRDLLLTPYISAQTSTLEARYRQAFARGDVTAEGAVTRDDILPGQWRGYLLAEGAFALSHDWRLTFDAEVVSDPGYLLDYGHGDKDRLDSQLAVARVRADSLIVADVTGYTTLREGDTLRSLPPLVASVNGEWRLRPDRLGGMLTVSAGAEAFVRPGAGTAEQTRDVARAGAAADWRRDWVLRGGVLAEARLRLAADLYAVTDDPATGGLLATARPAGLVALRWPLVRRAGNGAVQVLEPVVALVWSDRWGATPPNEDSPLSELDEGGLVDLSHFPGQDGTARGPALVAGATWTRSTAGGRSVALSFGRILRTDPAAHTRASGLDGTTSDWLVAGRLDLGDGLALRARSLLDTETGFGKTEARLDWQGARVDLAAAYLWLPADAGEDRAAPVSEWTVDAAYRIGPAWTVRADGRFDVAADRPVRAGFGLTWENECVTVDLSLSRRYTTSDTVEAQTDFGLSVTLNGFSAGRSDQPQAAACAR